MVSLMQSPAFLSAVWFFVCIIIFIIGFFIGRSVGKWNTLRNIKQAVEGGE